MTMTDEEYIAGLENAGYDPAHDDPDDDRNYCRHGNYIGSPGGPDYMCGYCESGDEPPTAAELAVQQYERMKQIEAEFDKAVGIVTTVMQRERPAGYCAALANGLLEMAETSYFSQAQGLYHYA